MAFTTQIKVRGFHEDRFGHVNLGSVGSDLVLTHHSWQIDRMARPLRVEFESAVYHITVRGNARQDIFLGDEDRVGFLAMLADVIDRFGWICPAYCLMSNHYHLLIETPQANLSKGMR